MPIRTGSAFLMLVSFLVCLVLVGRFFDHVLTGYHLPAVICALSLAAALAMGGFSPLHNRVGTPLLLFLGWMFLSTPFSTWRGDSATVVIYFSFFALMWLPLALGPRNFKDIVWLILLLALLNLATLLLTRNDAGGRLQGVSGTYANSEDIALIALLSIPFWALIASRSGPILVRILVAVPSVFFLIFTAARTGSRAALFAGGGMLLTYFLRTTITRKLMLIVTMIVVIPALIFLLPRQTLVRLSTVVDAFDQSAAASPSTDEAIDSASQRHALLIDSIRISFQHPLFGVGPGQFAQFRWAEQHEAGIHAPSLVTHNAYTEISSEEGIPGLIFFIAMLVGIYRTIISAQRMNVPGSHKDWQVAQSIATCLQIGFISIVIFGLFLANAQYIFWYLMGGLALALERVSRIAIAQAQHQRQPSPPVPQIRPANF